MNSFKNVRRLASIPGAFSGVALHIHSAVAVVEADGDG